jgi:hypothetical protein
VAVALAAGAWLLLGLALFVLHAADEPGRADAVAVLAGSKHRLPLGQELVRGGAAPVLVVSRDPDGRDRAADRACGGPPGPGGAEVVCFVADPYSTRGEARTLARIAAERDWSTLVVVTSRFHLFRSRLLVERCFGGEVRMASARVDWWRWPVALVSETLKLVHALAVARDC